MSAEGGLFGKVDALLAPAAASVHLSVASSSVAKRPRYTTLLPLVANAFHGPVGAWKVTPEPPPPPPKLPPLPLARSALFLRLFVVVVA